MRCPECGASGYSRKTRTPEWRCRKCGHEWDVPKDNASSDDPLGLTPVPLERGNAFRSCVLIPIVAVFFFVATIALIEVVLHGLGVSSTLKSIVGILVGIPVAVLMTRQVLGFND